MRIAIINRYYPPNQSATGNEAFILAEYLNTNHEIYIFCERGSYHSHLNRENTKHAGEIVNVPSVPKSKNALLRLVYSFLQSFALVFKARKFNIDFFIVLSDPPFLPFWSALLLCKKRMAFWLMDVYPDAFHAGGFVSKDNLLFKMFMKVVHSCRPELIIGLGKKQIKFVQSRFDPSTRFIELIAGIDGPSVEASESIPSWYQKDLIHFGYIGNLGYAHDIEILKRVIANLDPNKHRFIISGYGTNFDAFISSLSDKPQVIITSFIPYDQFKYFDIHIVTLKDHWTHISVPSKALTALRYGLAILFLGNKESDIWEMTNGANWHLDNMADQKEIHLFLDSLDARSITAKKQKALDLAATLISKNSHSREIINNLIEANE